jgi:hypothetical protein
VPVVRALRLFRVDLAPDPRQPSSFRVVVATAAAIAGSLGVDALLVFLGERPAARDERPGEHGPAPGARQRPPADLRRDRREG